MTAHCGVLLLLTTCYRELMKNTCEMLMIVSLEGRTVYEEYFENAFVNISTELFQVSLCKSRRVCLLSGI